MAELPLAEKVAAIHASLDEAVVPHALGGAMALAYYGEPRTTVDIDLNLFVSADRFDEILSILGPLGVEAPDDGPAVRDGQAKLSWGRNPVDLFFAYDPFHDAMADRARTVPFAGGTIPILAPEHLIVCKAAFDRPKDWIDIEQMLVGVDLLDREELDRWLGKVLGPDDGRTLRVREIWARRR